MEKEKGSMAFPFVSVTGDQDGKSDIKPDEQ